jgi:hypothetical protein
MLYVANFTRKYNNTNVDGNENRVFFPGKIYTCRINISQNFFYILVQAKMLLIIPAPTLKYPLTAIAVIRRFSKLALLYKG